jgi:protein required for attachment to host cells
MRDRDILEILETDRKDVFSIYLDVDGRKQENQGAKPAYAIWVQHAMREALKDLSGEVLRLASRSARRIMTLVSRHWPEGRGLIIFAAPGLWKEYHVPVPVPNRVRYGPPDVTVAIDLVDQYKPYAILVVDHEHARILRGYLGDTTVIEEDTLELHTENWRAKTGRRPTSTRLFGVGVGRGAQRDTFDARVDARRRQFLTEVARATAHFMHEKGIERLILSGADDVTGEVRLALAPEVRSKIIGVVALESHAGMAEIRDRTLVIALDAEQRQDAELVGTLLDRTARGGAVTGIEPTLDALKQGRVLTLVVDRSVLAEMPTLPLLARRHGAQVAPVQGPPADGLRAHGGIGAILRYAIEAAMLPSPGATA